MADPRRRPGQGSERSHRTSTAHEIPLEQQHPLDPGMASLQTPMGNAKDNDGTQPAPVNQEPPRQWSAPQSLRLQAHRGSFQSAVPATIPPTATAAGMPTGSVRRNSSVLSLALAVDAQRYGPPSPSPSVTSTLSAASSWRQLLGDASRASVSGPSSELAPLPRINTDAKAISGRSRFDGLTPNTPAGTPLPTPLVVGWALPPRPVYLTRLARAMNPRTLAVAAAYALSASPPGGVILPAKRKRSRKASEYKEMWVASPGMGAQFFDDMLGGSGTTSSRNVDEDPDDALIEPLQNYLDGLQLYFVARGPPPPPPAPGAAPMSPSVHSPLPPYLPPSMMPSIRRKLPTWTHQFLSTVFQVTALRYTFVGERKAEGSSPWFMRILSLVQLAILVAMVVKQGLETMSANPLIGPPFDSFMSWGAPTPSLMQTLFGYESWRLLAPPFLHAGFIHLLSNLSWQLSTGLILERAWGTSRMTFIFYAAAVFGTLCSVQVRATNVVVVGASGGVCGLMGATFADHILNHPAIHFPRAQLIFWTVGAIFMFGLGLLPIFDNITHSSGFVGGFVAGLAAVPDLTYLVMPRDAHVRRQTRMKVFRIAGMLGLLVLLGGALWTLSQGVQWQCGNGWGQRWCCWLFLSVSC